MKIYAAPLQGYAEAAWRNAHEAAFGGVDAYFTPFIRLERGEVRNKDKREISAAQNSVRHLIPQIIAGTPEEFRTLTRFVTDAGYNEIDVNMGCPFPMMALHGKGSGLLPHPERIETLLRTMEEFPEVRFSVKTRLGWSDADEWRNVLPLLNGSCIAHITLHPRIGKQQYKGETNMEAFDAFHAECRKPLIYNGDLRTPRQIADMMGKYPDLAGVMLGRGLLSDPSLALAIRAADAIPPESFLDKVSDMHRRIYEQYAHAIEGGEAQLLSKLKPIWDYLLPDMDKKRRKAIAKSTRLDAYLRAVEAALH